MSCGIGHSSDPTMLWLMCRPAATALIGPLAWETQYAVGAALEKGKKKKESGDPVMAQWLRNPTRGCRFDPWPCSVG